MIAIKTTMPTIMPIIPPKLSSSPALVAVVKGEESVAVGPPAGLVTVAECEKVVVLELVTEGGAAGDRVKETVVGGAVFVGVVVGAAMVEGAVVGGAVVGGAVIAEVMVVSSGGGAEDGGGGDEAEGSMVEASVVGGPVVGGPVGMKIVVGELETVIEGEKIVVAGLEPCGMVKEGMTAFIRLVNLIALRTAEHSGPVRMGSEVY